MIIGLVLLVKILKVIVAVNIIVALYVCCDNVIVG